MRAPVLYLFSGSLLFVARAWTTFDVLHTDNQDDMPGLVSALESGGITANATVRFAAGTLYNAWSAVKFPALTSVEIVFEGNVSFPDNITAVQQVVGASNFPGAW
ncbi:hypothetical protein K488DRAFT_88672 [Vararia minispora EC-137]|uniref:Uncharacterized protein n=1 Tax=Vararia minispora EC-137 TaxID=1314806 RepID=A0ACB8QD37_9AGAM|nr:hypothetical protein K488DRAFT_88672 [Vararia minispora EC-137]